MNESSRTFKLHALWQFDVDDLDTALEYFGRATEKMPQYGGRPISMGRFRSVERGDNPIIHQFYVLAEIESEEHFQRFADDPAMAEFHSLRENSTTTHVRYFYDGLNLSDPAIGVDDIISLVK